VIWNGGVAVGDAEQHPVSFNLSNLYFFLLVAFVLFLPFNIEQLPEIKNLIGRNGWIVPVLIAGFFIYYLTYEHPHIYNTVELSFYRHNLFIYYTSDITPIRIASYFPMAWMALSFVTAARNSEQGHLLYLMYPFALLSFVPLPLIEQRYYVVALTLFLVWRPPMSRFSTLFTLVTFIALSAWILFNITRQVFFL
jgi:alpha-1,2-glucosyltransferase